MTEDPVIYRDQDAREMMCPFAKRECVAGNCMGWTRVSEFPNFLGYCYPIYGGKESKREVINNNATEED